MHQEILLRHVNFEDLDNAFKLFSDKCARKNSRNTNNISYKEHKSWFLERIEKDGYFTIEDIYKNFVGQARIEKLKNENIISINILSAYRNKGYGLFALKCLISKTNNLTAYINLNNVPSIKLFEKAGFKKISQSGDFLKYYFSNKVFIIAEISANHCNDIVLAKKTISEAKKCGADAVKLQTYTADTLTIDCKNDFFKISGGTSWDNKYYYDLYKESSMDWEWQKELKRYAEEIGIELFSTPFDKTAVDFLESINVKFYKIASFEAIDFELIKYTALKQKPMIISTGISSKEEIQEAVDACKSTGNYNITLLKCTSAYPAQIEDMNLITITDMIEIFGKQGVNIGLSDHSMNIETVIAATALGARVIEKHFTLDRSFKCADSAFSLNPKEFKEMVEAIRNTEKTLGNVDYSVNEKNRKHARSIFICKDVKKGDKITEENIKVIRPSDGLHPRYFSELLGKRFNRDIDYGTPLKFEYIER